MKETHLSDEELNQFLDELGLYEKSKPKFKVLKKNRKDASSLKVSLFVTLSLLLLTLVQAAFTLPLYTQMKRLERSVEKLRENLLEPQPPIYVLPEEFESTYPEEEVIEPLDSEADPLYKNA